VSMITTGARYCIVFSALLSFALSGCSKKVERSQVLGDYQTEHQNGIETIELRADGTYTQHFKQKDGADTIISDDWEFEPYNGDPKVALHNFRTHFPQPSEKGTDVTLLGIERHWGRLRLYLSYDRDEYYSQAAAK
jgi:hypothetical protein